MRGTRNRALFDKFVVAVLGFPPTARDGKSAEEVFAESYGLLSELAGGKPPYPRAIGWKAYALALSVYEGWPLPQSSAEARLGPKKRLDLAKRLAVRATKRDPTDFDVHWALADVCLIRNEFGEAKKEFETALYLNRDERNPNLFAEAAAAMMHIGEHDKADKYFHKAMHRPDWHHWMKGILLFMKAGRAGASEETFLDLALDELKATRAHPGDDLYQHEVQLVLAAVHWRKWKLLSARARALKDDAARRMIKKLADRNKTAAKRAIRRFRATFNQWTVKQATTALPFNVKVDKKNWLDTVTALWGIPLPK